MALELDLMPLEEKPPEPVAPKTIVVRYGYLKQIGEFVSEMNQKVGCGSKLVCRTERGTEICEMLTTTCSNGGCGKSVTREKMLEYIGNSGGADYPFTSEGRVLRVATPQDLLEQDKLNENRKRDLTLARDLVTRHRLQMKIVEVEYLLGGERVMFYFLSEHRVDFRTLVREMAHELHTRIELRQVGARDEARITADYEKCGQHCCCKQFLKVLTPISMRAAKVQKATLDPAKISGRCGRLMCCLRYEDQTYEELRKKLPRRNTRVKTEQGEAWVIDGQILTQLVMVQYDDGKRAAVAMELITAFDLPKPKMANGQTMQTPNDRMPEPRPMEGGPAGPGGPGVRPGGPGAPGGPMQRRGPGGPPNGPPIQGGPARPVGPGGPGVQQRPGGAGPQGGPGPNAGPKLPPRPPERGMPPKLPPRPGQQQGQNAPQQNRPMPNQTPPPVRDEIDDLMADAMDEGPMAVPQASAEAAAAPMPPVEPEVKPMEGGDEDRPPMIEPEEPRIM